MRDMWVGFMINCILNQIATQPKHEPQARGSLAAYNWREKKIENSIEMLITPARSAIINL